MHLKMHPAAFYYGGSNPTSYSNLLAVVADQKGIARPLQLPFDAHSGADGSIAIFQAGFSILVLLLYSFRNLVLAGVPRWLKPFAQEEAPRAKHIRKWTYWTLILAFVSFCGLSLAVFGALSGPLGLLTTRTPHLVFLLDIVPWLVAVIITAVDRPTKTPKLLLVLYLFKLLAHSASNAFHFLDPRLIRSLNSIRTADAVLTSLAILVIINMPLREPSWGTEDIARPNSMPNHLLRSPEDNLTLFQFLTMSWVTSLAKLAKVRDITVEDVWQLPYDFQHTRLYMAFRELEGKLLPCLIEANGLDLFISTTSAVVEKVSEVSNIRLTSKLYQALDHNKPSDAVFWCLVMLCVDVVRQFSKTSSGWYSRKAYERSRGETFIGLFSKLLTRAMPGSEVTEKDPNEDANSSNKEIHSSKFRKCFGWFSRRRKAPQANAKVQQSSASNAKVVNLVRGDTYEISQRFWDFPKVVSQPIKVVFTVYYLIDIMGWTSCIGFALMVVFLGVNSMLVSRSITLERQRAGHSDRRAQAVSHFVEASRPLKLNGWTSSWSNRIMKFRDLEMAKRLQIARFSAAIATVNVAGGAAYPLASICLYTLILGQGLPNDVIWPSLQLFGHLETSVKEAFDLLSAFWKATIPVERVNKYMAERDRDEHSLNTVNSRNICFFNASFSRPSTDKLVLRNLTLSFAQGLTLVRGKVGSGKSSLLLAALNEMEHRSGTFSRPDEPVAYCQQLPWLESKTIQENIVFHQPWNAQRYREVLNACALVPDLQQLARGDQTKLEEGGIGLSGGQKARVALARAVYSHARILLLDDPLAALDHDTASTIVQNFLQGPLAENRTIVLVTHRDDLVLRLANWVIDISDGEARCLSRSEIRDELQHPSHAVDENAVPQTVSQDQGEDEEYVSGKGDPELDTHAHGVPLQTYTKYMKAGGWMHWAALAIFYAISRCCDVGRARLLEAWGKSSTATGSSDGGFWGLPDPAEHPQQWLYVLAGISAVQIISYAVAQLLLAGISINAARKLFRIAIDRVSKAPFHYHDITPTGQLKNRLISDMGMVDGGILAPLESFVYNLITLTLSLIAIMSHQPSLLFIIILVSLLFVYFFQLYVPISRSLRRMEMKFLTPIIANIGVMQDGLVTIRAMRVESHFQNKHLDAVDDFQKQDHFFWSMAFWLDYRLGMSSATMRFVLIVFMVWYGTPASAVGFVLTQTTVAMGAVQQLCEKFAALQLDAVSLERVDQLSRIQPEENGDQFPPEGWPRPDDAVIFQGVVFHYLPGLPKVLDDVSFEIPGGSTCAILGRTGSGKSTIANALLVTREAFMGSIRIGDVELKNVDRETLRKRITYIQQDPTLFPGTLRDNIDPEGTFSDDDCERAIQKVLGEGWNINSQIDAGGKNLSQGQRQMVGIVRAVLRRSGLIILDEATASIDRLTASMVQLILREELSKSTVLTIAHRLEAVEDADWCLRLDKGSVVESGPRRKGGAAPAVDA